MLADLATPRQILFRGSRARHAAAATIDSGRRCYRPGAMDLRPLRRHRDFRWLYTAQSVSFLGTMEGGLGRLRAHT